MTDDETAVIKYQVEALNFSGKISFTPYIDGDVKNEDANYDEKFWDEVGKEVSGNEGYITVTTKKTDFHVCTGMKVKLFLDAKELEIKPQALVKDKYIQTRIETEIQKKQTLCLVKYAAITSSMNYEKHEVLGACHKALVRACAKSFETMLKEQAHWWQAKWEHGDIIVNGDVAAQQGIRFNIFQLNQTYTGEDERLNIGPKGFTGEKYGGSTYWDTEAYCLPFYLATAEENVSRNLLKYRHKQLDKAIENAQKLGFKNGAALYPMVTMNGEECHNEWEITFEEIHRNGAIAFAIYDYVRYTGDKAYLAEFGLEVLIAISRFWSQRVSWSEAKKQYVMLGVTGPNEYENNVNNNWYTSKIAIWTLKYTQEALEFVKQTEPTRYTEILEKTNFNFKSENEKWSDIIENMYFAYNEEFKVFMQQDGFMDKEQILAKDLPMAERPINQNWSWDRILRSVFIKQADVLQGIYLFEDEFDMDTIHRNFDFYEPRTVHESSLSPCVHSIIASKIGDNKRAYQFYLRTARLDLDDYNNEVHEGCHITSMAGTWMSFVKGFGGMRIKNDKPYFAPYIPEEWESYSFKVNFRQVILQIFVSKNEISIHNLSEKSIQLTVFDKDYNLNAKSKISV
jgi:maltose phosphorylase